MVTSQPNGATTPSAHTAAPQTPKAAATPASKPVAKPANGSAAAAAAAPAPKVPKTPDGVVKNENNTTAKAAAKEAVKEAASAGSKAAATPLNVAGPISDPIAPKLREKLDKVLAAKRLPHDAAFTGWKEVSGFQDGDELTDADELMDLLTTSTFLDEYLPEAAYGDWYHLVAIIILASLLSWFFGYWRFSLGPVFFVIFPAALYYRASVRKYRQSIRMEAQREFSVNAIEDDFESMDWMNVFLEKFWPYLEPYVAEQVCTIANPIMADLPIPAFVKQLWLHTFTVGTKPPRIDKVRTLERTADDVTVMDWLVSFTPNATEDNTEKQLKNRTNQKVVVKAKLFGFITIPVAVSDFQVHANVRVRLRMMTNFPHIQTVNVSMMEPPRFDVISKPLGGDSIFWPDSFNIPGIYMLINEMILKYAGPMVFSPLSFELNLEQLLAGNGLNGALGILELSIKSAKDLKGADTYGNTIDPYFTFSVGGEVLAKTKVVEDTTDPVFNQKVNVMLKSSTEPLAIRLYDENESDGRKDKFMGAALFDLDDIMHSEEIPNLSLPILRNNHPAGTINFGLKLMKALQGSKLPDGSYSPPPDLNTGVVTLKLLGARSYSEDDKKPGSAQVDVFVNKEKKLSSGASGKVKEVSWNLSFEDIVTDRAHTSVHVILRDATKNATDKSSIIGSTTLRLTDIIDASFVDNLWFPMNTGDGEVKLSCEWSSVRLTGVPGAVGYTEPIGVVRVFIEKAEELLNIEKFGTIDPYIRLMVNGVHRGRTVTVASTTDPKFSQSIYVPVSSPNQRITIEAMDVERNGPDRTLGSFQVRLDKFIDYDDKGEPIETIGDENTNVLVHKRKGAHGSVTYSLAFFPCEAVRTPTAAKANADKHAKLEAAIKEKTEKKEDTEQLEDELAEMDDMKPKSELSATDLAKHSSGILVFSLLDGQVGQGCYFQAFFDMQGDSTFETQIRRSGDISEVGDAMIKELEYSTVTFRLSTTKGANIKKDAIAEVSMSTSKFLQATYDHPATVSIGGNKIRMSTKFIPVDMTQLPPNDSIGNTGTLTVKILSASGLPAADKNGYSDPFCRIYLNGEEEFKTKTIKKSLDPEWNEQTTISIDNRVGSVLRFKVVDWDVGVEADDELGEFSYPLAKLDPFHTGLQDATLALVDEDNKPAGTVKVQFQYQAEYHTVLSAEKSLPNVGGTLVDGAGTVVGGAGKAVGAVAGTAGKAVKGVGKVGSKVTGIFHKKK